MTRPFRFADDAPRAVAHAPAAARPEADFIIRPAAIIPEGAARQLLDWLDANSLVNGGLWNAAAAGVWQRYDKVRSGAHGGRDDSQLVGGIYVTYDLPRRHEVVLHRVQITDHGLMLGWTTIRLVDELLAYVGLSIATCPRDTSGSNSYRKDPFRMRDAFGS